LIGSIDWQGVIFEDIKFVFLLIKRREIIILKDVNKSLLKIINISTNFIIKKL